MKILKILAFGLLLGVVNTSVSTQLPVPPQNNPAIPAGRAGNFTLDKALVDAMRAFIRTKRGRVKKAYDFVKKAAPWVGVSGLLSGIALGWKFPDLVSQSGAKASGYLLKTMTRVAFSATHTMYDLAKYLQASPDFTSIGKDVVSRPRVVSFAKYSALIAAVFFAGRLTYNLIYWQEIEFAKQLKRISNVLTQYEKIINCSTVQAAEKTLTNFELSDSEDPSRRNAASLNTFLTDLSAILSQDSPKKSRFSDNRGIIQQLRQLQISTPRGTAFFNDCDTIIGYVNDLFTRISGHIDYEQQIQQQLQQQRQNR